MRSDLPTMKLAVISDIHANAAALEAVLSAINNTPDVAQIICLGDIVGFHTQPSKCIELVRKYGIHCISGNHDAGVTGKLGQEKFPWECWEAIEWTRRQISNEEFEFLRSLQTNAAVKRQYWMMHGVLGDVYHYMNRDWKVRYTALRLWLARIRLGFYGHTHQQTCFRIRSPFFSSALQKIETSQPVPLDSESIYLLNPGTIGQPRAGDSHARFAIVDLNKCVISFEKIPYDYSAVVDRTLEVFPRHAPLYKRFDSLRV